MVRNRAAGRGFSVEQKRNAVCAVILGPLRADKEPLERKPQMPMTAEAETPDSKTQAPKNFQISVPKRQRVRWNDRPVLRDLFGLWDLVFGAFRPTAAATRIVSLNVGSQTLGLAEFRMQPQGGLLLHDYSLREILAEPAGETMRQAQMARILREMMDELRIKSGTVNYAAAGQSVFTRFVKLPSVEEEKIERIISFEAQQNVPFPIDEVVWDYQLVGGGADEQIEVVLVAIKTDLLDEINQPLPRAAAGQSAGPGFSVWRQRQHALHARVFSGEIAAADRVFQSVA